MTKIHLTCRSDKVMHHLHMYLHMCSFAVDKCAFLLKKHKTQIILRYGNHLKLVGEKNLTFDYNKITTCLRSKMLLFLCLML